jgi:hypothetical protein
MPTTDILKGLQQSLNFLRLDGIFVKSSQIEEDKVLLETTTYITDTDDGRDIDCLCANEDDLGLIGSCICEDITTGNWLEDFPEGKAPRGCVACPVCQRMAKPWKLQKRCYKLVVRIDADHVTFLDSRPDSTLKEMPNLMSGKIIQICNSGFPVWSHS